MRFDAHVTARHAFRIQGFFVIRPSATGPDLRPDRGGALLADDPETDMLTAMHTAEFTIACVAMRVQRAQSWHLLCHASRRNTRSTRGCLSATPPCTTEHVSTRVRPPSRSERTVTNASSFSLVAHSAAATSFSAVLSD